MDRNPLFGDQFDHPINYQVTHFIWVVDFYSRQQVDHCRIIRRPLDVKLRARIMTTDRAFELSDRRLGARI